MSACHRYTEANAPLTDGDYTVSIGNLFEISENTAITNMVGIAGISWARRDKSAPSSPEAQQAHYSLLLTCNGDLQFWRERSALIWHTGTAGKGGAHLILNARGELLLYSIDWSHIVWRSHSGQRYLPAGSLLPSGRRLVSGGADVGDYVLRVLTMQRDGNLVYRVGGKVRWQTGTHVTGAHAAMTRHGQLVVVGPAGHVRWSSRAIGSRVSWLDVEYMRIDSDSTGMSHTIWQANTSN